MHNSKHTGRALLQQHKHVEKPIAKSHKYICILTYDQFIEI